MTKTELTKWRSYAKNIMDRAVIMTDEEIAIELVWIACAVDFDATRKEMNKQIADKWQIQESTKTRRLSDIDAQVR